MNLGFAVDQAIQKEKKSDTVNLSMIKEFKKGCQRYITATLQKLFERSPLWSNILCSASVLDPSKTISMSRDKLHEKWKMLLKYLVDLNVTSPESCDKTPSEFMSFVDDDLPKLRLKNCLLKKTDWINFFFDTVAMPKYNNVSFVIKLLLTLSHCQTSLERGFSNNKSILKINMSVETVFSKRLIKDHILANGLKPRTIEISKPIIKAFRNARAVYKAKLEEERKNAVLSEREKQAAHISNDIEKMKQQVNQMNKSIEAMDRDFVDCTILAERNNDLALVRKGNELNRKCNETEDAGSLIEKQVADLKEKKRKLVV